jgi:hypothetical protein
MNVIIYNKSTSSSDFLQIIRWCNDYFGPGSKVYSNINAELHRWSYDISLGVIKIIYIKEDRDMVLFKLKWGHR